MAVQHYYLGFIEVLQLLVHILRCSYLRETILRHDIYKSTGYFATTSFYILLTPCCNILIMAPACKLRKNTRSQRRSKSECGSLKGAQSRRMAKLPHIIWNRP